MTQAERYVKLAALTGREDNLDSSYHAAFYLLSYDPEVYEIAARHVTHDGISFPGLKRAARSFDERTRQVIDVAHNLFSWTSKCSVSPFDISRMGFPYMELVCNACYIAVGEVQVVIQNGRDGRATMTLDDSNYQRTKHTCMELEQFQNSMVSEMEHGEGDELEP